jgi:hypothetical protein
LRPCPDYVQILGAKEAVSEYALNCAPVGHIGPGSTVKFEMRIALPLSLAAGPDQLQWALHDARLATTMAWTQITVS